jgi:predicted double-glycine peptidase
VVIFFKKSNFCFTHLKHLLLAHQQNKEYKRRKCALIHMKKFRLLMDTRQSTEYSCGASALQAVLSYWGKDLDEKELMELLHTTPETGTYPEDIVRTARELGFEAEIKENLTIEDLEKSTRKGIPVIALGQAWLSRDVANKALAEDWEDGHYVVILAVDKELRIFRGPLCKNGKRFHAPSDIRGALA